MCISLPVSAEGLFTEIRKRGEKRQRRIKRESGYKLQDSNLDSIKNKGIRGSVFTEPLMPLFWSFAALAMQRNRDLSFAKKEILPLNIECGNISLG